ncbi:MAG: hypothetical protein ACPG8W_04810 [Candidatus Promineifilaceae bacterium]
MKTLRLSNTLSKWLPSRGNVLFTLLVLGLLFWAQSVGAIANLVPATLNPSSTNTISYQGYLADENGYPVNGDIDMTFRIYETAIDGIVIWDEEWIGSNAVQVTDGVFSTMLGSFNSDLPQAVQGQTDLYLGISIGSSGAEIAPRTQFGSAFNAMQSLTVPDGSITQAKLAPGLFAAYQADATTSYWQVPTCSSTSDGTLNANYDIPGMSLDFTLDAPSTVLLDMSGLLSNREGGRATYANLMVNGELSRHSNGSAKISGCRNSTLITDTNRRKWCPFVDHQVVELNEGTHNISATVWCDGTDTAGEVYNGTIRAVVLP